jgi:hypothetical protein
MLSFSGEEKGKSRTKAVVGGGWWVVAKRSLGDVTERME